MRLQGDHLLAQLGLGPRRHPEDQGGAEHGARVEVDHQLDHLPRGQVAISTGIHQVSQGGGSLVGHVGDRGHEQVLPGREVVLRRPA